MPGIEPISPALAGGFLTTGPPGKSCKNAFCGSSSEGILLQRVKVGEAALSPQSIWQVTASGLDHGEGGERTRIPGRLHP